MNVKISLRGLSNRITNEKVRAKTLIPYWETWDND